MTLVFQPRVPSRRLARAVAGPRVRLLLSLPAFALVYFLAARLGIATSIPPGGADAIAVLWPANSVILAVLLVVRRQRWWLFFLATVATEIAAAFPEWSLWAAAGYGLVNFSEAAIAALLLTGFGRRPFALAGLRDFIRFLAFGPGLAAGTAALFGAVLYKLAVPEIDYLHYWRVFWLGDAIGLLIVGTALLAWRRPAAVPGRPFRYLAMLEAATLAAALAATLVWMILSDAPTPRSYVLFPFLVWAALRFGVRGATLAILATVVCAVGSALWDAGPFAELARLESVTALQGLIAVVALSTFMLGFSTEDSSRTTARLRQSVQEHRATEKELRRAHRELERVNRELDRIVAGRTRALRRALAHNEMLLREVHHRVKNNLQLVSSLIGLHARSGDAGDRGGKLADVQGQIAAIAATYDVLQQEEGVEEVNFCDVVPRLCRNIEEAIGERVSLSFEASGAALVTADTAVALSLALNELITNAIKHAAAGGSAAAVDVRCRQEEERVLVSVADDGPGFPPDFDPDRAGGFGMRMIRSVLARSGGSLRLVPTTCGALVEIAVPAATAPAATTPGPAAA